MADVDYYKVLDLSRGASDDEIRKAYRKLAREYHPDMKPNDKSAAEKFKSIQEAYSVLSDPEKREQYDRYGAAFQGGRGGEGQPFTYHWSAGPGGGAPDIDLSDLFGGELDLGDLFGGTGGPRAGRRGPRPRKGADLRTEVHVPFLVSAEGGEHELHLQRDGRTERLTIKVPPGVDNGSVIRLAGQGQPGLAGGPSGDLLVTIRVAPHPYFHREGNNLRVDVPVTPTEAALGAKVEVPTLTEGKIMLTIPPGTSSGTKLRLRGKGVIDQKTKQRGDQYVVVKIVVPKNLSPRAEQLFQELAEAAPLSPRERLW
jgi:curved DNA-binding protein